MNHYCIFALTQSEDSEHDTETQRNVVFWMPLLTRKFPKFSLILSVGSAVTHNAG